MIGVIALKEIRENFLSLRFLLLLLLAVIFIPASLYTNYRAYLIRVGEQQQIEKNNRDYLNSLGAAQVFTNPDFTIDIYWPPSPTSVFAAGFEQVHPRHLLVGKHSVEFGAPLSVQTSVEMFGNINFLFVVQFIFSLFAVLLSFDAITREKESGTLRTILANPLSRAALASGKLLGGYITLAIPLIVSFLVGLFSLEVAGLDVFSGEFLSRAAWILVLSMLYIAVFFLLGLLVSSVVSSTHAALVLSLTCWLVVVLVLPRAASLTSQLWQPVKSRQIVRLEKVAAVKSIDLQKGRAVQEASERFWVLDGRGRRVPGDDWREKRQQVTRSYEERAARAVQQIEEDTRRRRLNQRRLGLTLARLSPAGAFVSFLTEMSNTGIQAEDRFMAEAERYRSILHRDLFSKIYRDELPGGSVRMGTLGTIQPGLLTPFRMTHAGVGESFRGTDMAILLTWLLMAAALIYVSLSRYDVR